MSRQAEAAMMVPSRRSPVTLGEPPGPNSTRPTVRSSAIRNIPRPETHQPLAHDIVALLLRVARVLRSLTFGNPLSPLDSIPLARLPLPVLSRRPLDLCHPSPSSAPDAAHAPAPVFRARQPRPAVSAPRRAPTASRSPLAAPVSAQGRAGSNPAQPGIREGGWDSFPNHSSPDLLDKFWANPITSRSNPRRFLTSFDLIYLKACQF